MSRAVLDEMGARLRELRSDAESKRKAAREARTALGQREEAARIAGVHADEYAAALSAAERHFGQLRGAINERGRTATHTTQEH